MAYDYKNLPVLSKVKIGESVYYLKDAEVRALIDAYGDAVNYNVDTTFNAESENLATAKAVATYLEQKVAGLTGAMHFVGAKEELPEEIGAAGDVIIVGTAEYVSDGEKWILIGDEGVYATVAGVEAAYVKQTLTIAGIDLKDAITADELKTALGLGELAYKDNASATVTMITGVEDAEYTPAGTVNVSLKHTETAINAEGTFKPSGDISGTTTAAGSVGLIKDNENGFQLSGTVSAPVVTVTPATAQVQHIDSLGTLPTYTPAEYVAPSMNEEKSQFATAGLVAAIDGEDSEMLVFSAAAKAEAVTTTNYDAGSYEAAKFDKGALPTLGESQTVVIGITEATASAPVFTGDKIAATFTGTEAEISATFAGKEEAIAVAGTYDKAAIDAAEFVGAAATISHDVTTEAKVIVVE